jgi:antitoxin component YwqK of YwqJK toxin-antitoxin module
VISERGTMAAGRRDGLVEKFDARGRLTRRATYHGGLVDGVELELHYHDTSLTLEEVSEVTYAGYSRDGRYRTNSTEYGRSCFQVGQYSAGKKTGTWLEGCGGKVETVTRYVAGNTETRDEFDPDTGVLVRRWLYKDGRATEMRELSRSGVVERVVTYSDGEVTGRKVRDKRGQLVDEPAY